MNPVPEIIEKPVTQLAAHRTPTSCFEVSRIYQVEGEHPAAAVLNELPVHPPWLKIYAVGEALAEQRRSEWNVSNADVEPDFMYEGASSGAHS